MPQPRTAGVYILFGVSSFSRFTGRFVRSIVGLVIQTIQIHQGVGIAHRHMRALVLNVIRAIATTTTPGRKPANAQWSKCRPAALTRTMCFVIAGGCQAYSLYKRKRFSLGRCTGFTYSCRTMASGNSMS